MQCINLITVGFLLLHCSSFPLLFIYKMLILSSLSLLLHMKDTWIIQKKSNLQRLAALVQNIYISIQRYKL
jgi:hypothetical protein